jgi:hypothetical protein
VSTGGPPMFPPPMLGRGGADDRGGPRQDSVGEQKGEGPGLGSGEGEGEGEAGGAGAPLVAAAAEGLTSVGVGVTGEPAAMDAVGGGVALGGGGGGCASTVNARGR